MTFTGKFIARTSVKSRIQMSPSTVILPTDKELKYHAYLGKEVWKTDNMYLSILIFQ